MANQTQAEVVEKPPFLIPLVAGFLVWLETLLVTASSLMLTFVAVLTVASALNGGALLAHNEALAQAYAWCQGLGIEGQLSGMTFQAMRAARHGQNTSAVGYWLVALILGFASVMAIGAVNYQQSFGVTFEEALLSVGISQYSWVWLRAGILVGLLMLAAAMRYQPVFKESTDAKIARIQEQARINAARAEAFKQNLGGFVGAARSAVVAATAEADAPKS